MRVLIVLAMALPVVASDPAGFAHWTAADLKSHQKSLAPKMNAQKVATDQLGNFGNHVASIAHREGDGVAELHEKMADVFLVVSGAATLVVGGKVVGGKQEGPGEVRGPSIEGGVQKKLAAGDVVHIPANTPHQLLVATQFTYFVLKVSGQ